MTKLIPSRPDGMLTVLTDFNLRPSDTFKIVSAKGVLTIHNRKANGEVQSMRVRAKGSFKQATSFDPSQITIAERRELEAGMHQSGLSQSEIADLLGVSQATVSLDLRKHKKQKS
jgi:DNA-binding NarL/FixJ family response regulator